MGKVAELIRKLVPRPMDVFAILLAGIIGLTLTVHPDNALTWSWKLGNVPYGVVWSWINPGWCCGGGFLNPAFYEWYLLVVQLAVTAIMFWLVKKGKMNRKVVYLYMATTIFYRNMTVFQEITPTMFLPFASINPLFSLGFFIQKYPFWTLIPSLADPHYQCAMGNCVAYTIPRGINSILDADFSIHLTMLFWLITPIYSWWMKRRVRLEGIQWNENNYWSKMTSILFMIMAYGLFWLVIVGCCYGWSPPVP